MSQRNWTISFDGLQEGMEASLPALLTVGNGRLGMRGTLPELCPAQRDEGLLLAGFFDQLPRPELDPASFNPFLVSWSHMERVEGYKREVCLVKAPLPFAGGWEIDGIPVDVRHAEVTRLERALDMESGQFSAVVECTIGDGRHVRLECCRFASMARENLLYERRTLTPLNFSGRVRLVSHMDTGQANFNISGIYQDTTPEADGAFFRLFDIYRHRATDVGHLLLQARGRVDGLKAAFGLRVTAEGAASQWVEERACGPVRITSFEAVCGQACQAVRTGIAAAQPLDADPFALACSLLADAPDFEKAARESVECWAALWCDSDVCIDGDDRAQVSLRHGLYQLLIAASRSSDAVSVAAKGLSGEGYRGMVFWDTDIHMLPFYLHTQPSIARSLVAFRANTLAGAQGKAAALGFGGAAYPWETGISGREECEDFLKLATYQAHITADVVYAMNEYVTASGDTAFYVDSAIPVYLETARFWLSKGCIVAGELHIPSASGPDELHLECDNNAYVNNLAALNLALASEGIHHLQRCHPERWDALRMRTGITQDEVKNIHQLKDHVRSMRAGSGVFEQCEGFFTLEDRIVYEDDPDTAPAETQTVKQADVMMLLYLAPGLCTPQELRSNWDYYEPRTTHTSSLSYGVHGILASRLGLGEKAQHYIKKALEIDLYEQGAGEGAHLAADGMGYSAVVQGLGGAYMQGEVLHVTPALPDHWERLCFSWRHRNRRFTVDIARDAVRVTNDDASASALEVCLNGQCYTLQPGETTPNL